MVICNVDGCENKINCMGYCSTHYRRLKLYGDPLKLGRNIRGNCSVIGCNKPHDAKGYCYSHYRKFKLYGDPTYSPKVRSLCSVEGCKRIVRSQGLCQTHLWRLEKHGDVNYERVTTPICIVEGCDGKVDCHGYCPKHLARWRTHGDPNYVVVKNHYCTVEGCDRRVCGYGLCNLHYNRMRKTGSTELVQKTPKNKYRILKRPEHPLSGKSGFVYEHRMVLYDYFKGREPLWCVWCGIDLYWSREYLGTKNYLIVDHMDHNRRNNKEINLLPSCSECNKRRSYRSNSVLMSNIREVLKERDLKIVKIEEDNGIEDGMKLVGTLVIEQWGDDEGRMDCKLNPNGLTMKTMEYLLINCLHGAIVSRIMADLRAANVPNPEEALYEYPEFLLVKAFERTIASRIILESRPTIEIAKVSDSKDPMWKH